MSIHLRTAAAACCCLPSPDFGPEGPKSCLHVPHLADVEVLRRSGAKPRTASLPLLQRSEFPARLDERGQGRVRMLPQIEKLLWRGGVGLWRGIRGLPFTSGGP